MQIINKNAIKLHCWLRAHDRNSLSIVLEANMCNSIKVGEFKKKIEHKNRPKQKAIEGRRSGNKNHIITIISGGGARSADENFKSRRKKWVRRAKNNKKLAGNLITSDRMKKKRKKENNSVCCFIFAIFALSTDNANRRQTRRKKPSH